MLMYVPQLKIYFYNLKDVGTNEMIQQQEIEDWKFIEKLGDPSKVSNLNYSVKHRHFYSMNCKDCHQINQFLSNEPLSYMT